MNNTLTFLKDIELLNAEKTQLIQTWGQINALELPKGQPVIHELYRGELGLLSAVTNVGKSTLLRNLALSITCGRPYPPLVTDCEPRKVLYLDFETRLGRLQADIRDMAGRLNEEEQLMIENNLAFACDASIDDEPFSLSTPEHFQAIASDAVTHKADLIVVDTLSAGFAIGDENNNGEVAELILKPLVRLAKETNAAVLLVHHIGKAGSEEGRTPEQAYRARGASAFGTYPAVVFNLIRDSREANIVTLSLAKVKGEKFPDVTLKLDPETRWFDLLEGQAPTTQTAYDLVLDIFKDGRPHRRSECIVALGDRLSESAIEQALAEAIRRQRLMQPSRGYYQSVLSAPQYSE